MIFFFIMSGLFFSEKNLTIRLKRLLLPWLYFYVIGCIITLIRLLLQHNSIDWMYFVRPFTGATSDYINTPLWFLWALSVISLILTLLRLTIQNRWVLSFVALLLGIMGYVMGKQHVLSFYYLSVCFLVTPFFLGGNLFRQYLLKEQNLIVYLAFICLSVALYCIRPAWCNISQCSIPMSYARWSLLALSASYGLMGICLYIDKINMCSKILSFFGRNSLIILCTHIFLVFIPNICQSIIPYSYVGAFIGLIVLLVVEVPIVVFINRYTRFLLAR